MEKKFDTIIIGGGLSGLLCGTLLSKKGQKICILEKNLNIGGAIQPFRRKKFSLDTGMHFFGSIRPGQIQYELFKSIGIENKVEIVERKDTVFRVLIGNKEYVIPVGFEKYKKKLIEYFPDEKKAISKYIFKIKEIFNSLTVPNILSGFVHNQNYEIGAYDYINNITKNKIYKTL